MATLSLKKVRVQQTREVLPTWWRVGHNLDKTDLHYVNGRERHPLNHLGIRSRNCSMHAGITFSHPVYVGLAFNVSRLVILDSDPPQFERKAGGKL